MNDILNKTERMDYRVLFLEKTHEVIKQKLSDAGIYYEDYTGVNPERLTDLIGKFDGLVVRSMVIGQRILAHPEKLRFIGRVGSGMDNIDVEYAASKGIHCFNSAEGSRDAVGEHTLGLLLSLFHNINRAHQQVKDIIWDREYNRGIEVKGKTIAIIGYGNMGSSFAEKASALGARVIAYDKYKNSYTSPYVIECSLEEIFETADVCSLHVPLTKETSYMFNAAFIESFEKEFFLINTSRGKVVNTADLVWYLKNGKIRGAALDVIEYEETAFENLNKHDLPGDFYYLINAANVILTPHIAGYTDEAKYKLALVLAQKIIRFLTGE